MTSVVIAAHNEAAVIGRCLDALLAGAEPGEFDVTVVANGCTDDTAAVAARRTGVRVLELAAAGKPAALNAGDRAAVGFPRIYLDADITVTAPGLRAIADRLRSPGPDGPDHGRHNGPGPFATAGSARLAPRKRPGHGVPEGTVALAAVPRRELDLAGRPLPVRGFFAINSRLPVYQDGLFGRGLIALSAQGRGRFDHFPDMIADDLFLDSLFAAEEKVEVTAVAARIATPRRTGDLVQRLVRVRRGNAAMRGAATRGEVAAPVRPAARLSWLRDVVLPRPWLAPAALCYVTLTVVAAVTARRSAGGGRGWERDESTRAAS